MKFSGEMYLQIILKVTKNLVFTLSLEDTFQKTTGKWLKLTPPSPCAPPAFLGLNFLIIDLCISSVNCSFCLISDLKPLPLADLSESEEDFLSKIL